MKKRTGLFVVIMLISLAITGYTAYRNKEYLYIRYQIEKGDLIYSCNCGWVDISSGHMKSRLSDIIRDAIYDYMTDFSFERTYPINYGGILVELRFMFKEEIDQETVFALIKHTAIQLHRKHEKWQQESFFESISQDFAGDWAGDIINAYLPYFEYRFRTDRLGAYSKIRGFCGFLSKKESLIVLSKWTGPYTFRGGDYLWHPPKGDKSFCHKPKHPEFLWWLPEHDRFCGWVRIWKKRT